MDKEWVTLYKYFDVLEGQRIEKALIAENIPIKNISRQDSAFDGIFVGSIGAGVIQVREDYIQQAKKIVIDFEKEKEKILKDTKREIDISEPAFIKTVNAILANKYLKTSVVSVLIILFLIIGFNAGRAYYFKFRPDLEKGKYYSEQGKISLAQGNYKEAVWLLRKSIMFHSNLAVSYARLGYAYFQLQKYEEAIKYYEKAISIEANDYRDYGGLGSSYMGMGYYHNAISAFKKAIELNPKVEFAYTELGMAYERTGNYDLAIVNFKETLRINPNSIYAYTGLSSVYYYLKDFDRMLEYAKKVIEIDPANADGGYYNAGLAYLNLKLNEEAKTYFEKAIKINPKYAPVYYCLGFIYKQMGDEASMRKQYDKLVELKRIDLANKLLGKSPERLLPRQVPFRF